MEPTVEQKTSGLIVVSVGLDQRLRVWFTSGHPACEKLTLVKSFAVDVLEPMGLSCCCTRQTDDVDAEDDGSLRITATVCGRGVQVVHLAVCENDVDQCCNDDEKPS